MRKIITNKEDLVGYIIRDVYLTDEDNDPVILILDKFPHIADAFAILEVISTGYDGEAAVAVADKITLDNLDHLLAAGAITQEEHDQLVEHFRQQAAEYKRQSDLKELAKLKRYAERSKSLQWPDKRSLRRYDELKEKYGDSQ